MRLFSFLIIIFITFASAPTFAHCQIPCGIYDDERRFEMMLEHATTIEKSMNKITELSKADTPDIHMISRWTANKEKHAQEIQDIAAEYFLAQRVKVPAKDADDLKLERYTTHLARLHNIIVMAMKNKQTLDLENKAKLVKAIKSYQGFYMGLHGHKH